MSDALATRRWGLQFVADETERAYAAWQAEKAVPFARIALWLSLVNWLSLAGMLELLGGGR